MSFSSNVKEELSRQLSSARHCQIAEIAAIISLCGRIQISEKDWFCIKIHTENAAVARKYFTLLKKTFNINMDVSIRQGFGSRTGRIYTVGIRRHEDALRVLRAAKLLDRHGEIGENLLWRTMWSFSRTAASELLSGGHFWQQVQSVTRKGFTILRLPVPRKERQSSCRG